jgi:hypothetical protein
MHARSFGDMSNDARMSGSTRVGIGDRQGHIVAPRLDPAV